MVVDCGVTHNFVLAELIKQLEIPLWGLSVGQRKRDLQRGDVEGTWA